MVRRRGVGLALAEIHRVLTVASSWWPAAVARFVGPLCQSVSCQVIQFQIAASTMISANVAAAAVKFGNLHQIFIPLALPPCDIVPHFLFLLRRWCLRLVQSSWSMRWRRVQKFQQIKTRGFLCFEAAVTGKTQSSNQIDLMRRNVLLLPMRQPPAAFLSQLPVIQPYAVLSLKYIHKLLPLIKSYKHCPAAVSRLSGAILSLPRVRETPLLRPREKNQSAVNGISRPTQSAPVSQDLTVSASIGGKHWFRPGQRRYSSANQMTQCVPKSVLAHPVPLQDTRLGHRRCDHGELAPWTAIAILDAAMLVLCTMSLKLDPSLTQAAVVLVGP